MSGVDAREMARPGSGASWKDIAIAGVWFGCICGLVEGICLWAIQRSSFVPWGMVTKGVTVQIIWVSTLVDVVLFGLAGLGLALLSVLFRRLPVLKASIFVLAFLVVCAWLSVLGRMRWFAIAFMGMGLATVFTRWFEKNRASVLGFWRRTLPWVLAAGVLAYVGIEGGIHLRERIAVARLPQAAAGAPNVLLIVVDTLRADHVSAYGYSRETTPHLDRLAREGVLFENTFAGSCWSPPSHASIVTGLPLSQHHMEWDHMRLEERFLTIAEYLRGRGYRTEASSGNKELFTSWLGFDQGFIRFDDINYTLGDAVTRTVFGRRLPPRVTVWMNGFHKLGSQVNADAIRWIRRDASRPFFVMINYFDPHAPYMVPPPFRDKFLNAPRTKFLFEEGVDLSKMTQEQLDEEIGAYDGTVAYMDDQLGALLSELEKSEAARNTLVIVTADHGDAFGEHGSYMHRNDLYAETVRVPLVMWWPGKIPAGVRIARPVSNDALPATIENLLGDSTQTFPGRSLAQLWTSPESEKDWPWPLQEVSRQPFIASTHWKVLVSSGWLKALVSPQWRYIVHEKLGAELYDRTKDPKERQNLAGTPEAQAVLREFEAQMKEVLAYPRAGTANAHLSRKED